MDRDTRFSADGRWPVDNSTSCHNVAVRQIRASSGGSGTPHSTSAASTMPTLESDELTLLTAWAEGVAEAAAYAPERIDLLLAAAGAGATWRAELGLPEPSPRLADAIESLGRVVRSAPPPAGTARFDALLTAADEKHLATQRSTRWSGAPCSPCLRNGEPGKPPNPSTRGDSVTSALLTVRCRNLAHTLPRTITRTDAVRMSQHAGLWTPRMTVPARSPGHSESAIPEAGTRRPLSFATGTERQSRSQQYAQ